MNLYKKIIKSRDIRKKIIHIFDFVDDKKMLKIQYRLKTGNKLNLKNPKRYTEKLQWYKLYYRDPLMSKCSDKYLIREYVKQKGLESILNENYGHYMNPDDVDFSTLPNRYVIKCTTGSGDNIIVSDSSMINEKEIREKMREWLIKEKSLGREWCYYDLKPSIIVEKFIDRNQNDDLPDYKFFCFNGKVYCLYVMVNYTKNHANGQLGFYDKEFRKMPYCRMDYRDINFEIEKPKNFDLMVKYAEILSADFPHVRVDFYNVEGKIIFGELTFYNASGYTKFNPDEFDYIMGEQFILPAKKI